jgi:hypothetical protein
VIWRVRKLALETSRAAIVIVKRTGITVPLVVPVTRIRNRLELGLRVVDRRTTLFRIDDTEVILVALTHENYYLVECLLCFGRFWILPEKRSRSLRELCEPSVSVALVALKTLGGSVGQRTDTSRGELEAPLACLSTPKACFRKLWIKAESAVSALLCQIISEGYLARHPAAQARCE